MQKVDKKIIFDSMDDIGEYYLTATYQGQENQELKSTIKIQVIGPNLRSTEEDTSHLFFKTSDGRFLNIKVEE